VNNSFAHSYVRISSLCDMFGHFWLVPELIEYFAFLHAYSTLGENNVKVLRRICIFPIYFLSKWENYFPIFDIKILMEKTTDFFSDFSHAFLQCMKVLYLVWGIRISSVCFACLLSVEPLSLCINLSFLGVGNPSKNSQIKNYFKFFFMS